MKIKLGLSNSINIGSLGFPKSVISAVTYSISGTVFDSDGTTAVSGATVAIGSSSTTSAANGTFTISGLAAGTSGSLTCTLSGYSWTSLSVSSMTGNLTGQNFRNIWYAAGGLLASVIAAYAAVGAASVSASKVNLANPGTRDLTGTNPTWSTSTGWTDPQLDTTFVPTSANWSMFVRYNGNASGSDTCVCGRNSGGVRTSIFNRTSGGLRRAECNGALDSVVGQMDGAHVLGFGGNKGYVDGVAESGTLTGWSGTPTSSITIGIEGGSFPFSGTIQVQIMHSVILNATQAAILTTAMNALP